MQRIKKFASSLIKDIVFASAYILVMYLLFNIR